MLLPLLHLLRRFDGLFAHPLASLSAHSPPQLTRISCYCTMSTGFCLNRRFRISCGETSECLTLCFSFARSLARTPYVCVSVCLYWQFKRTSSHYVDFVVSGKNEYMQLFLDEAHSSIFFLFCVEEKKTASRFRIHRGIIDGAYLLCEKLYHSVCTKYSTTTKNKNRKKI